MWSGAALHAEWFVLQAVCCVQLTQEEEEEEEEEQEQDVGDEDEDMQDAGPGMGYAAADEGENNYFNGRASLQIVSLQQQEGFRRGLKQQIKFQTWDIASATASRCCSLHKQRRAPIAAALTHLTSHHEPDTAAEVVCVYPSCQQLQQRTCRVFALVYTLSKQQQQSPWSFSRSFSPTSMCCCFVSRW